MADKAFPTTIGRFEYRAVAFDGTGGKFVTLQTFPSGEHGLPDLCIYMSRDEAAALGKALVSASCWETEAQLQSEELPF